MALPPDVMSVMVAIADELDRFVEPVVRAARHPASLQRLLHQAGWDVEGLLRADQQALLAAVQSLKLAVSNVMAGPVRVDDVAQLGDALADSVVALARAADELELIIQNTLTAQGVEPGTTVAADLATRLIGDLADLLLMRWLAGTSPMLLLVLRMVGVICTVQRPALYLNDPPETPAVPPGDSLDDAPSWPTPVRWPMRRLGLNIDGLTQPMKLAVAFIRDLPADAFRSPAGFLGAVTAELTGRIESVLAELAARPIGVLTISITDDRCAFTSPSWLPTTFVDWQSPVQFPLEGPDGPLPLPLDVRIEQDTWSLLWDPGSERDVLEVVAGTLFLVDRFEATSTEFPDLAPGVSLTADVTDIDAIGVKLTITAGFELRIAEGFIDEIAITATASLGPDGVDVSLRAAVLDTLEIPLIVPGLSGMRVGFPQPSLQLFARDLDEEPRLDVEATLSGFTLHLPTEIFRKAAQGTDGQWTIEEGASPVVEMTLPSDEPLLSLGIATTDDGLALDRFAFLPVGSDPDAGWELAFAADALFIGGGDMRSGVVIEIESTTYTAPPASSAEPFGSITISRAEVHLPAELPAAPESIVIEDATIDENGFSGEVSVAFATHRDDQELEPLFGVIPIAFQSIALVIEENLPTEFELKVAILLPYFDEWVDVTITFDDHFNLKFFVESVDPEGITLTKEELLRLNFRSAKFEWNNDERRLGLGLSGGLEPLLWNSDGLEWPRLDVTDLEIDQVVPESPDAPVEPPVLRFAEAWLDLKDLATLDLFGFHFELNRLGMGYVANTDELWVDLTGSLRLIEQIPIGLGVEGFRIIWPRRIYEELGIGVSESGVEVKLTVDEMLLLASRIQVRFDGIYLWYGIPQAVEFEGYIRFIKTAHKIGFAGDVALRVPTSGLAVEAGLMVGMNFGNPPYPFLYVYFGILLPSGIPLGQSGLALKGAKGLFGLNVEPDREPEQNPYYDWYKRGPIEGAHPTNKWRDRIWSIAFGAGITITTTDGKILGVQGLLALAIPGPIIFVEGKALIFDGVFPGDSPLKALGYFDGTQLTTQLNIEASMELIEGVVDVMAGIEAFFDFRNLLNWHLYLGQDVPEDRRIHANFLKLPAIGWLFGADAYLMIDMPHAADVGDSLDVEDLTVRARMGVHIGFEPPAIDLVVASAEVRAVLDGGGLLTINPFLFTGAVDLDAVIDIDAFGLVIVGVQASAEMSIEGALPLDVQANIGVRVDLPVPDFDEVPLVGDEFASALDWFEENVVDLPDIPDYLEVEIPLHWRLDEPPVLDPLVSGVSLENRFAQGGVDAMPEVAGAVADAPVVALDSRPLLRFDQNVNVVAGMQFGGFSPGGSERFFAGQLAFVPTLTGVRIFKLPAHEFIDGVSEQWTEVAATPDPDGAGGVDVLWGMFRPVGELTDSARAGRRNLELWNANPFEHLTGSIPLAIPASQVGVAGGVSPTESLGIDNVRWCGDEEAREWCVDQDRIEQAAVHRGLRPVAERHLGLWQQRVEWGDLGHGLVVVGPDIRFGEEANHYFMALDSIDRGERIATLQFPSRVAWVRVRLLGKEGGTRARRKVLTERRDAGYIVQDVDASVDVDHGSVTTLVVADPDGFDELLLSGRSALHVIEVCWVTLVDTIDADARKRACDANAAVTARATDPGVVLSPGAFYRIEIDTSVRMDESASEGAAALLASLPGFSGGIDPYRTGRGGPFEATDTFYFRTEGPPANLRPYVKWMSPNDGSTGRFTGDDLAIRFNRPYLHRFYPDDDNGAAGPPGSPYALDAYIEDAEGHVRSGWFLNWTTAASATLVPEEQHWFHDLAPQSAPGVTPPPDDILEIRRHLEIRSFFDTAADAWHTVRIEARGPTLARLPMAPPTVIPPATRPRVPTSPVRPGLGRRVQWKHVGANEVSVRLHGSTDTHLYIAADRHWGAVTLDVDIEPALAVSPGADAVSIGMVVLYLDEDNYHVLRLRWTRRQAVAEILVVRNGKETVLASKPAQLGSVGFDGRPHEFGLSIAEEPTGMTLGLKVAGVKLVAADSLAPKEGWIGLATHGTDAVFRGLAIGSSGDPLQPGARYTVSLAGGGGGPTRRRDEFTRPMEWWESIEGWSYGEDGLEPIGAGSVLRFGDDFDDGELTTTIIATDGDRLTIGLRTADDRRGPVGKRDLHRCELDISLHDGVCSIEMRVRSGHDGVSSRLDAGETDVGNAKRLPIRVRMIGDKARVWIFDRELIKTRLQRTTFPNGTSTNPVRRGSLEWRVAAGTPALRCVHVCEAALLRYGFTTGPESSFAARVDAITVGAASSMVTSALAEAIVDHIDSTVALDRQLADARAEFHAVTRRFALKRANRDDVEAARQALTAARSTHDEVLSDLLLDVGAGPLVVPTEPSIARVETDAGLIVGWVLRSPGSLDPAQLASSSQAVFASVGRTSFSMLDAAGGAVGTHWVASADGTTVLVYRIAAGVEAGPISTATDLRAILIDDLPAELEVTHVRDHRDDESDLDHVLDRQYDLARGSRADMTRRIALP